MSKKIPAVKTGLIDPNTMSTSPWANAQRGGDELSKPDYPDMDGMKFMIIIPNDFYRKKLMPLGPGYVATTLRRCNVDVSITDCSIFSYDDIELAKIFIESGSKIFAIGALYPQVREVERICSVVRAVVPDVTIILGGSLPTPIPEFALKKAGANIAVIGEAELTLVSLMRAMAGDISYEDVKGIAYIKDGEYFDNGKPVLPKKVTFDEVGWPAVDLYPIEHYITAPKFYPYEQGARLLPIVTGRGCPYSCNFCFRVSAYRIRPFDDILDEMEYLQEKYNLDGFYIVDDLLMLSIHKIKDFCERILERGMKIRFNCTGRVNTITPEVISLLKQAGCIAIFYGLESGNEEILNTMSKQTKLSQIYEAVRLTRDAGIYCEFGVMFGQPGEDQKTIQDSVDMLKKIAYGEYRVQKLFGCVPFPGSGLYDWCKEEGLIKDDQDFYDKYISQDWSLDQLPINMTSLSDKKAQEVFKKENNELSEYFQTKIEKDWVEYFGGDASKIRAGESMDHIKDRVEASSSTFDTSGRT